MTVVGDLIEEFKERPRKGEDLPVLTLTERKGFVLQSERFKKRLAIEDTSSYKRIGRYDFAFNPYLLWAGAVAQNSIVDGGVISPLYPTFRVRPGVDARYVNHLLLSAHMVALYDGIAFGSVPRRRRSSVRDFLNLSVPVLPPLDEQRRIAAILDQASRVVVMRKRSVGVGGAMGRAAFLQMFGHPAANPRNLPLAKLVELGDLDRGVSRHRPRNDPALLGGSYPLIQTGEVANSGGLIRQHAATYSDLGLAQSRLWPSGTLCITIAANIAKTGVLTFDACFPDSIVGFTSDRATTIYVQVWLSFLQAALEASAPQSAQKNINLAVLRALSVPVPDRGELERFARVMDAIALRRRHAEQAMRDVEDLAAVLQQQAFSGQL